MRFWPSLDRRKIYRYHDGLRFRFVDPLATYRALDLHPTFNVDKHAAILFDASSGNLNLSEPFHRSEFHAATEACVAAARDVLGVPPFDKGGLDEASCIALVLLFLAYLDRVQSTFQAEADAATFYGCDMERIRNTDYLRYVAYTLLIPRGMLRRANEVRVGCVAGIESALANAPVPKGMLRSVVSDPALADVVYGEQVQSAGASRAT